MKMGNADGLQEQMFGVFTNENHTENQLKSDQGLRLSLLLGSQLRMKEENWDKMGKKLQRPL